MIIEPVLQLLETANIGLVGGQNLFAYFLPADVMQGVVVLPSLAGNHISYELPDWRKDDTFQIICRASSALVARDQAKAVQQALQNLQQFITNAMQPNIPAFQFSYIRAMHDPIVYPRQLGGQTEASVNYQATYVILQPAPIIQWVFGGLDFSNQQNSQALLLLP